MSLYAVAVLFLHTLLHDVNAIRWVAFGAAVALIALVTFSGQPVLFTGVILAALVAVMIAITVRRSPG